LERLTLEPGASTRSRRAAGGWGVRRGLTVLMWLTLGAYVAGLATHGVGFEPLVDRWLSEFAQVVPPMVCWAALPTAGVRRREVACMAAGMTMYAAGNSVLVLGGWNASAVQYPPAATFAVLCFYPAMLVAIGMAVQRQHRRMRGAVWLDSALGALGAAAVLVVLLDQVFKHVTGSSFPIGLVLIFPAFDLLLIAAVVGIAALQGGSVQRYWLPLLMGLVLFATADVAFLLRVLTGSYVAGTPLDACWPVGLTLMSVWVASKPAAEAGTAEQPGALAAPAVSTAAGLAVLVAASRTHISSVAVALATLTLIATAGRTQLAFQQLRRLADLRRQATTDDLTGLPNRRAFYAHVNTRLAGPGGAHALLLLDLDKFKEVNDSLGHQVGDQLLQQVSARLADRLREGDMLARLGGDEFAVLLSDTTREEAVAVAVKLGAALTDSFTLEGIAMRADVSIGVSLAPEHGCELSLLLRRADIAMYKAKSDRIGHRVYADVDDIAGEDRLRTLAELRTALTHNQLTLHYQPKVNLATNEVHDVEALVRWDHPSRGLLYPDAFLTLVEDAGLMRALTQYVLEQALDQAAVWREGGRPLTVAVNLSASSLVDTDLPAQVSALLAARHLPASALQLEITEEFLMTDRDRARTILRRLRELGVQISIDDFGTGYSSLAYLRELPVDELKLDRSFVFPMADDARAAALVFSTIELTHSLGLRMVAEGVENEIALTELAGHGCDQAQGYHISRPVPAAELDHWLDRREQRIAPDAPRDGGPSSVGPAHERRG
jgi:diguanylate cyclase (GGDEF)-like protein